MEDTLLYKVFKKYAISDQTLKHYNSHEENINFKEDQNTSKLNFEVNSYHLDYENFERIINKLKKSGAKIQKTNREIISAVFMLFDSDCDSKLSFSEFSMWWESKDKYKNFSLPKSRLLENARLIYLTASKGKNVLNIEDLENYMQEKNIEYTDETAEAIDADGSGNISFQEFGNWLNWF